MKIGIYSRVSTDRQTSENQRIQLLAFASSQGWTVVREFTDTATGSNGDREGLRQVLEAAARREFDLLLVYAVDRVSREGAAKVFGYLSQLTSFGVKFHSFSEPHLSTAGPFGDVVLALYATFARLEREKLVERTKAGLVRARRDGKRLGRPKAVVDVPALAARRAQGASFKTLAAETGLGMGTIHRALAGRSKNVSKEPTVTR